MRLLSERIRWIALLGRNVDSIWRTRTSTPVIGPRHLTSPALCPAAAAASPSGRTDGRPERRSTRGTCRRSASPATRGRRPPVGRPAGVDPRAADAVDGTRRRTRPRSPLDRRGARTARPDQAARYRCSSSTYTSISSALPCVTSKRSMSPMKRYCPHIIPKGASPCDDDQAYCW